MMCEIVSADGNADAFETISFGVPRSIRGVFRDSALNVASEHQPT